MSKQTKPARTCANCLHCQACHLWSSGEISDSVAPKCPQFEPARNGSLAELQDLYRMYKGGLVPVVRCKDCKHLIAPGLCSNPMAVGFDALEPNEDDFCSRGEKKEEPSCNTQSK